MQARGKKRAAGQVLEGLETRRMLAGMVAPTDLQLDNLSVGAGQAGGSLVAVLSAVDPEAGEKFTYGLADGVGAEDNALFVVTKDQLRLAAEVARPVGESYAVRLRVTDLGGLGFEKAFTIWVRGAGTTFVVDSLADVVASDGVVTLREALEAANSNTAVTADVAAGSEDGTDRITFDMARLHLGAGVYPTPSIVLDGADLKITDHVEIIGPGSALLVVDGDGRSGVIETFGTKMISISGVTISGGSRGMGGGGILQYRGTLSLTDVVVRDNMVPTNHNGLGGGGVFNHTGDLLLQDVTVSDNTVAVGPGFSMGGGILVSLGRATLSNVKVLGNAVAGRFAYGGGVCVMDSSLTMVNVGLHGNLVQQTGETGGMAMGGGFNAGSSLVTAVNVAATGNRAESIGSGYALGGGMYLAGRPVPTQFTGTNLTISGNHAVGSDAMHSRYGGLYVENWAQTVLRNSIVSLNTAGMDADAADVPAGGHNLVGVDPLFVSMAGSDWTQWDLGLQATSPGVDAGNSSWVAAGISVDLRGAARTQGGAVDIGAYETDPTPVTVSATINGGAAHRSMVKQVGVTFSERVTLSAGAVTVRLSNGAAVPNTTISVTNPSGDGKTWVVTFGGMGVVGGSLGDGVYDLVVDGAKVQDLVGNVMSGNYSQRFHRLFGDSNGDGRVNLVDYRAMRVTLGKSSGQGLFNEGLDYEAGGVVNVMDLAQFRRRFGGRVVYS